MILDDIRKKLWSLVSISKLLENMKKSFVMVSAVELSDVFMVLLC
jgi:hypothetical protein